MSEMAIFHQLSKFATFGVVITELPVHAKPFVSFCQSEQSR